MKIIMLGAPGAGKGTQAKKIAEKYDNVTIVDGFKLVPHLPEYFLADPITSIFPRVLIALHVSRWMTQV